MSKFCVIWKRNRTPYIHIIDEYNKRQTFCGSLLVKGFQPTKIILNHHPLPPITESICQKALGPMVFSNLNKSPTWEDCIDYNNHITLIRYFKKFTLLRLDLPLTKPYQISLINPYLCKLSKKKYQPHLITPTPVKSS